jgi:pyridoxamine 5'-phosphate oxidase
MTPPEAIDFYNDLPLTLLEIQHILEHGVSDRSTAAHHPVVATIDPDGQPSQRVMILRECNWGSSTLRFHTDARSDKISQLQLKDDTSVLIYDKAAKLQIRLVGKTFFGTEAAAAAAWEASTEFARRCYMAQASPGSTANAPTSGLPSWIEGKKPTEELLVSAQENFTALYFEYSSIDWLYLANSGHRRAKFVRGTSDAWQGHWLIP